MPTQPYKLANGKPVPGVTTVIHSGLGWGQEALMFWAAKCAREGKDFTAERDRAARIGTITHARIENALGGEPPDAGLYDPKEWAESDAPFKAFREWRQATDLRVRNRELALVSEEYGYGGTIDLDCILRGEEAFGDFKTSSQIRPSNIPQMAAYRQLLRETRGYPPGKPPKAFFLHIPRGCKAAKELTVTDAALDEGFAVFLSLLRIYRAQEKLALKVALTNGVKP